jgi:hypothetical protein
VGARRQAGWRLEEGAGRLKRCIGGASSDLYRPCSTWNRELRGAEPNIKEIAAAQGDSRSRLRAARTPAPGYSLQRANPSHRSCATRTLHPQKRARSRDPGAAFNGGSPPNSRCFPRDAAPDFRITHRVVCDNLQPRRVCKIRLGYGNSMMTPAAIPQKPLSVRGPFRLLAAFICLAGTAAVLGTIYMAWQRGTASVPANFIVWLPGMAWLVRLAFHAAVDGAPPKNEHWPWASNRVANCYFLVAILYSAFTPH